MKYLFRAKRRETVFAYPREARRKFFTYSCEARRNFLKYLFRAKRRENFFAYPREAQRKFFTYSCVARRKFFEVPLSREAQRNFFCLSARSAEKNLYLFARSAENFFLTWPYYFLCRRAAETRYTGSRPARRAEVALLFLVQEGGRTMGHWISAGA